MNRTSRITTIMISLLVLSALSVRAEVPQLISYQGHLNDDQGQPLDTTISMTFTIYDDSTGGSPIWTETHPAVTVTAGGFSVLLAVTADQILQNDLGDCYFGITVGSDPELSPRTQLTSVPYALHAASVAGFDPGPDNVSTGNYTFVAGDSNTVTGDYSSIGGGLGNLASGENADSTIDDPDGFTRGLMSPDGDLPGHAYVGGGRLNYAAGGYSIVGGGRENYAWGWATAITGGAFDTAWGGTSTIGGGRWNRTGEATTPHKGGYAVVGGGRENLALNFGTTIAGGIQDTASANLATISGGRHNLASGYASTISGGRNNRVRGIYSFVSGGGGYDPVDSNSAIGNYSAVLGGTQNVTMGDHSLVAGRRAKTTSSATGSFVWADHTDADFTSSAPDQFLIRASGGVGIGTETPLSQLDVAGIAQMTGFKLTSGSLVDGYVLTSDVDGVGTWQQITGGGGSDADWDYTTNAPDMFTLPAGNVGIGTSTPTARFHIGGNNTHLSTYPVYTAPTSTNGFTPLADPEKQGILFNAYTRDGLDSYRRYSDIVSLGYANGSYGGGVIRFLTNDHLDGSGIAVERMRIERDGLLGIGSTTPHTTLTVGGDITPDADGGSDLGTSSYRWGAVYAVNGTIQISDARWKTDINEMNYGLNELLRLRPVTYRWKDGSTSDRQLGLIAQEVQSIIGEVVDVGDDPDHTLGINYANLVPVLVKSIQEMKAENDTLKRKTDEIDGLRAELAQLKKLVEAVKQSMDSGM